MTRPLSQIGTVVVSIDVPAEGTKGGRADDSLARKLFEMLESRNLSASWVPEKTSQFSLNPTLATRQNKHDLALVGDATWIGESAGRTRFARELATRIEEIRAADINVSALALRNVELHDHLDLLVKHRVKLIRPNHRGAVKVQPQSVRFGVWVSPVSVVVPQQKDWSWFGTNWSLRQTVRRTIQDSGVAHVAIDAARVQGNAAAMSELDLVLAHLQRQRDKGSLAVTTLSGLGDMLVAKPKGKKAQSILRAA